MINSDPKKYLAKRNLSQSVTIRMAFKKWQCIYFYYIQLHFLGYNFFINIMQVWHMELRLDLPAGSDDVDRNFPVRAPPPRSDWMAWRSASCWVDSFWVAYRYGRIIANVRSGQGNFLSGNSVFACTCTSYMGMCFTGSPTVMCVLAGRPREIFGKEGEVYRFSGLNVPSAPSVWWRERSCDTERQISRSWDTFFQGTYYF